MNELFLSEKIAGFLKEKLHKNRVTFFTGIVVGVVAYAFLLTNKLICQDEIKYIFSKGAALSSGRWGLELMSLVFPDFSMPWIYGIITIIIFSISSCILTKIFEIENKFHQALTAGLVIAFPSLIGTLAYMFTAASYAVAFFLICFGVLLSIDKKIYKNVSAIICFTTALSIYQAYASVIVCLYIVLVVYWLLKQEFSVSDVLKRCIKIFVVFFISSVAYYAVTKLILAVTGTQFNSYATEKLSGASDSVIKLIPRLYGIFYEEMFLDLYGLIPNVFLKTMYAVAVGVTIILLLVWLFGKASIGKKLLLVSCVAAYPIGSNCVVLVTGEASIHTLTQMSFITIFLLALTVINSVKFNISRECVSIALAAIVIVNIFVSNEAYLKMKLKYENLYSLYTQIVTEIKMQPEYTKETGVAVIGKNYPNSPKFYEVFGNVGAIIGISGISPSSPNRYLYLERYLGFSASFASESDEKKIAATKKFKSMPVYPSYGSVEYIDGFIVVKLSDNV